MSGDTAAKLISQARERAGVTGESRLYRMTVKEAKGVIHSLSSPGKMPGYSWSVPAEECGVGSELREQEGTVCSTCYAYNHRYLWDVVKRALAARLQAIDDPLWVAAMVAVLGSAAVRKVPYFRWFDAGDIQGLDHLHKILQVVRNTPFLWHWLPTKEYGLMRQVDPSELPENLVVRLSAPRIDGPAPNWWPWTSTVVRDGEFHGHLCEASSQGGTCGDCRACWSRDVQNTSYWWHA